LCCPSCQTHHATPPPREEPESFAPPTATEMAATITTPNPARAAIFGSRSLLSVHIVAPSVSPPTLPGGHIQQLLDTATAGLSTCDDHPRAALVKHLCGQYSCRRHSCRRVAPELTSIS